MRGQPVEGRPHEQAAPLVRVLVADDDDTVRRVYMALLRDVPGVSSLIDAPDGEEAVRVARRLCCHIAILDFNMPRLDGVAAALLLRRLSPSTRVAVHSGDPDSLEQRAAGLGLTLFDKLDLERLLEWVEREAQGWLASAKVTAFAPRRDLSCCRCGYAIVSRDPPERCPICDRETTWNATLPDAAEDGYRSFG